MNCKALAAAFVAAVCMVGTAGAVDAIWDGGDDFWNSANWNGGQTAQDVFGRMDGSRGGFDVLISGASTVTYDQNLHGDLEFRVSDRTAVR